MSKTLSDLKKEHPNLIQQLEDEIMIKLGIVGEKGGKRLTEDEDKLTDEQKSLIRLQARNAAGIKR